MMRSMSRSARIGACAILCLFFLTALPLTQEFAPHAVEGDATDVGPATRFAGGTGTVAGYMTIKK